MWAAILEKAWAKVKGSYGNADGGYMDTGLRSLTGAPSIWTSFCSHDEVDGVFNQIKAGEEADYIMGAGTDGDNDEEVNGCGIATGHAYSVMSAFTMTDGGGTDHDMVMIRNPWGSAYYTGDWNKDDENWTEDLVTQVPYSIDPRTSADADGIFVIPKANLETERRVHQ